MLSITVIPVKVNGDIAPKSDLGLVILESLYANGVALQDGDILVVAQKVVSKAEGRIMDLAKVKPSRRAALLARDLQKDPRIVQLILDEAREIVMMKNGIIITETRHGFVCANSGVDQSNLARDNAAILLPVDPDASARRLRSFIKKQQGRDVAVVITDTFGRPFREGQTNVAVGVAGIKPIKNYIGKKDMFGKKLRVTEIAVADEIASAAELAMGKSAGIPVALVRGYEFERAGRASIKDLSRPKKRDIFRHTCNNR
ncbi:coenzyme F420-0:L-glutamate ligase [Nitrososphaera viennensis]|uniref:F420-0:gamma-L-glutamate ligase n=2 Tax=Nitrososphaera viennensis TaxID=1034015 RepID=A0A060HPA7_9ARCH|nr:coenzyme F420-0:L-glutamate ligase [Nitrososphaera viennensis]AIC15037.1 F420-0:gamma-L-glutamate ligase [Nitrososphaera viennensis EN76]UVS69966.1 coenzyme F420-0:L-glutamate ligase [Nitrososphaera viennensis]